MEQHESPDLVQRVSGTLKVQGENPLPHAPKERKESSDALSGSEKLYVMSDTGFSLSSHCTFYLWHMLFFNFTGCFTGVLMYPFRSLRILSQNLHFGFDCSGAFVYQNILWLLCLLPKIGY